MGEINKRLFQLLESDDKNQKELALYLGIDESTISTWKRRGTDPPSGYIIRIAEYFDVPIHYLIQGGLQLSDIVDLRYASLHLGKDDHLSNKEVQFCLKYRQLSKRHKAMVDTLIDLALNPDLEND